MLQCVTRADESDDGVGTGVTLEVGSAWVKPLFKFVKMEVESGEKMLGCVTRGDESDGGVGLRVTLEVGSAGVKPLVKFVKMEVESREKC